MSSPSSQPQGGGWILLFTGQTSREGAVLGHPGISASRATTHHQIPAQEHIGKGPMASRQGI
jgi:hypothetical protein